MKNLVIEAKTENLDDVLNFINTTLDQIGCPVKAQMQIDIAAEEIFVNIAHYAYESGVGEADVSIEVQEEPLVVSIRFADEGKPYNPLEKDDPDVTLSAEERDIGGLGIYMVKKSMDNVTYEYKDGQNVLTIYKTF